MKLLQKTKDWIVLLLVVVLASAVLLFARSIAVKGSLFGGLSSNEAQVLRAQVKVILVDNDIPVRIGEELFFGKEIHFYARVNSGEKEGEMLLTRQLINALSSVKLKAVEEGDRIMVSYSSADGEELHWFFQEYDRSGTIGVLLLVFLALMLLLGRKKGIGAILSLVFTFLSIFSLLIPGILSGSNIYLLVLFTCFYVITVTLILVSGFNIKSLSAWVGCVGGLLAAGTLFFVADNFLKLTGLLDDDTSYLLDLNIHTPINLKTIVFVSILIGVLGAVMDVGMSIASSLGEMYQDKANPTVREIVTSGMNIGRDIIGTMTNTLILAYIGGGISLTLLLFSYSNSFHEMINREVVVVEILQALLGSIGLLFTIPLTTVFYAVARSRKSKKVREKKTVAAPLAPIKEKIRSLVSIEKIQGREKEEENSVAKASDKE